MLIETASSQQQSSVTATLNLDHHPSAFHRVTASAASANGNESGTHTAILSNNGQILPQQNVPSEHPAQQQHLQLNSSNAATAASTQQHHQILLALIQQQLKGAASGGSTSAPSAQSAVIGNHTSDSNNNNLNLSRNCGGSNSTLLNAILHQQQRMNAPTAPLTTQTTGNGQQDDQRNEAKCEPTAMEHSEASSQQQTGGIQQKSESQLTSQQHQTGTGQMVTAASVPSTIESPCGGCRELKREVEELRQMLFQMQQEGSASLNRNQAQALLKPQSPPSPPHPTFPQQQPQANQQLRQALLQQQQAQQAISAHGQFTGGNTNNYNSHMLQMFLSQANQQQQHQQQVQQANAQQQVHPPAPVNTAQSTIGIGRMLEQLNQLDATALMQQASQSNTQWARQGAEKQQQQLLASTIQMLQQAAQIQQINGPSSQIAQQPNQQTAGSGTSTRNNSIQSGESVFFDPSSGMDVSETSSSASSTNTQMMLQSSPQMIDAHHPKPTMLQQLQAAHQQQQQQHHLSQAHAQQFGAQPQQIQAGIAQVQQQQNANRAQLELINAAINRTNAAVASHLLSPAHGAAAGVVHPQQQQQGNPAATAAKLATLQTLLMTLQQQQQQQQHQQQQQLAIQQRIQHQQQQQAVAAAVAAKNQQQKLVPPSPAAAAHARFGLPHQLPAATQFNHHQQQHQPVQHRHEGQQQVERVVERRRAASDDYIQSICSQKYTDEYIQQIQIPVAEAQSCDPNFRPLTEQQVIQQVLQNKKYENQSIGETMAQLCKKLAEKRVFGSRLMSKTTVAAPNHSSYSNLPLPGIIYIYHVCQKVLFKKIGKEEEFKEYFRDAMRKLAARCRRVRHARKNHHKHGGNGMELAPVTAAMLVSQPPFQQFAGRPTTTPAIGVATANAGGFGGNEAAAATISAALAELAARQQQQQQQSQFQQMHSTLGNMDSLSEMASVPAANASGHSMLGSGIQQHSGEIHKENSTMGDGNMDDDDDEDENLGQLSSPTISSQSTGTSTAGGHHQSPGEGDGDSEASDNANNQHHAQLQMQPPQEIIGIKHESEQEQQSQQQQPMQIDRPEF